MISSPENTKNTVGNMYLESQFGGVINDVRNGEALSAALGKVKDLILSSSASVRIGEETGRLDVMLEVPRTILILRHVGREDDRHASACNDNTHGAHNRNDNGFGDTAAAYAVQFRRNVGRDVKGKDHDNGHIALCEQ